MPECRGNLFVDGCGVRSSLVHRHPGFAHVGDADLVALPIETLQRPESDITVGLEVMRPTSDRPMSLGKGCLWGPGNKFEDRCCLASRRGGMSVGHLLAQSGRENPALACYAEPWKGAAEQLLVLLLRLCRSWQSNSFSSMSLPSVTRRFP